MDLTQQQGAAISDETAAAVASALTNIGNKPRLVSLPLIVQRPEMQVWTLSCMTSFLEAL